jgi:membrane-associated protease RseP (regulator of RpoE activity)
MAQKKRRERMRGLRNAILSGIAMGAMTAFTAGIAVGQTNTSRQPSGQDITKPPASSQTARAQQNLQQPGEQTGQNQAGNMNKQAGQATNPLGAVLQSKGTQGLVVTSVEPNEAAARAGLEPNDVIIAVDGRSFTSQRHLDAYLSSEPGRPVPFMIERNGRRFTIPVIAAEVSGTSGWLGVQLEEMPNMNAQPGQKGTEVGAEVAQVYPGSPAARAGLRPGDMITEINGKKIDDPNELIAIVHETKPQSSLNFAVKRNNKDMQIPVTIGDRANEFAESGPGGPGGEGPYGQGQFGPNGPAPWQVPNTFAQGPWQGQGQYGQGQYGQGQYGQGGWQTGYGQGQFGQGQGQYGQGQQYAQGQQGQYGQGQYGQGQYGQGQLNGGQYGNMPPNPMDMERDRQFAQQNQRIESELHQLREEIAKLREQIQKK